jgi:hypothetical protein
MDHTQCPTGLTSPLSSILQLMITIDMSIRLGAIVKQADAQKLKTI